MSLTAHLAEFAPTAPEGLRAIAAMAMQDTTGWAHMEWLARLYTQHAAHLRRAGVPTRADDVDVLARYLRDWVAS